MLSERRQTASLPPLALGRQVLSDVRTLNAWGYFVIFRGLTWLLALVMITIGAAPPSSANGPLLLLTLLHTAALIAYRPGIQERFRHWLEARGASWPYNDYLIIGTFDILLGLFCIAASDGWHSPFYAFAVVAVMVPAFVSNFAGAFRWATAYAVAYLLLTLQVGGGVDAVREAGGLSLVLTGAATPYLVAIAVSYYGQVSRLLEEEKERVEIALVENARLAAEKEQLAAQQERGRIAREIHDGIAQSLYILSLQLEACADLARGHPAGPQLAGRLDTLVNLSRQSLWEARQFIFDLKPLLAGDRSLRDALEGLGREFSTVAGIPVTFHWDGDEPLLLPRVRAAAYRILQESLANIYKHAHAQQATITVQSSKTGIILTVEDDGDGFTGAQQAPSDASGYGLPGMRGRAAEAGGSLTVESILGRGTRVRAVLPAEEG